jgi:hypothetical protein
MKLDYFLFMSEAEGIESVTTTRQTRINAAIKDFIMMARKGYDINSDDIQAVILEDHHIQDISEKECEYIARAVERNTY